MIKEIVKDAAILEQKSEPADFKKDKDIIQDLIDTANSMENCFSLSAIQIGCPKKIMVIKSIKGFVPFLNPIITARSNETHLSDEKCYSCPNRSVMRSNEVVVVYTDAKGKVKRQKFFGYISAVVQHTIEHFNGIKGEEK